MQPRPLQTENRMLRAVGADELRVSLGRAVSEIVQTPMMGELISRSFEQTRATSRAITDVQRQEFFEAERDRIGLQKTIEFDLATETDPALRSQLTSQLDAIYQEKDTQKESIFQQAIDEGRLQTPESLTEKYGDLLKFDRVMSDEEAKLLYAGKKEEVVRNAIVSRSPSGFTAGIAKFGGGMLAVATDPVEVATMFIPFVGPAGRAASVARFGRVGGRARVGAVEGTAGALLTEPLYYGLSKDQQLDYTMSEALLNVGAGLFLGGGIGTVAGMLSRADVDAKAVIDSIEIDAAVRADLEAVVIPEPKRMTEAEAFAKADRAVKQTREMYGITGGKITYETAIRQYVTDQAVQVEMLVPPSAKKPQTLFSFIKQSGGINDTLPTFRGEIQNLDIQGRSDYTRNNKRVVSSINNPKSGSDLNDMAGAAFEAGYIPERDTDLLMEALRREASGEPVFAMKDMDAAQDWIEYNKAKGWSDAEIERRDGILSDLEEYKVTNLSDEEVASISKRMDETGDDAIDAYHDVARAIENIHAEELARYGSDITNDPIADFEAAARFDTVGDDIELDDIIMREEAIIAQMREDGDLLDYQIKEIDGIKNIEAQAQAYVEVTEAATVCLARS